MRARRILDCMYNLHWKLEWITAIRKPEKQRSEHNWKTVPRNSASSSSNEAARVRAEFDILSMKFDTLEHRYQQKCESAERERESNAKALKMLQSSVKTCAALWIRVELILQH